MVVRLPAPAALYTPRISLVLISVRGRVNSMAIVQLEILGQLKKSNSGIRSRDFPACSIVPQPTKLPEGKRPLGKSRCKNRDNIKSNNKVIVCEEEKWIHLALDKIM
jgi:hypothetical protein